jgi:hypothetical protein
MPSLSSSGRDPRVDLLRGAALLTILVDHVPDNLLGQVTLRNWGFADAAEVFVFVAGYSSMLAYGRTFGRNGIPAGLRRLAARCLRIYAHQVGLLLATLAVVQQWTRHFGLWQLEVTPLLRDGLHGWMRGATMEALPAFLDILPLYIILLAFFPLIYLALRWSISGTLVASIGLWAVARSLHIDLPNLTAPEQPGVWFFDPFAWQLIFVLGAAAARFAVGAENGQLPRKPFLVLVCWAFLAYALWAAAPWRSWGLEDNLVIPAPLLSWKAKTFVSPWRLFDALALIYLILTSSGLARLVRRGWATPVLACGRHSLEVFSLGTLLALVGRLTFRTYGTGWVVQVLVNVSGFAALIGLALLLDAVRGRQQQTSSILAAGQASTAGGGNGERVVIARSRPEPIG